VAPDSETLTCLVCGRDLMVRRRDGTLALPDADQFRSRHADCLRTAIRAAGATAAGKPGSPAPPER